jgi:hypothetical protein
MENEFINYTQALALKELGFNEPCIAMYNSNGFLFIGEELSIAETEVLAPIKQQAFRWFREKYNMRVWVEWGSEYLCCAMIQHSSGMKESIDCCSNNEEAEQNCLDKLIEICKKDGRESK